ncbi:MAG: tail fiber domain-containing protein, partial [Alphaproteobacteria bacterium]|nr:tail fiber domain-containing protein [Alphaproteobacteria bacterium]
DNGTVAGNTPFTYNTMNTDLFMGPYNSATDTYSGSAAPSIHLHNGFIDGEGVAIGASNGQIYLTQSAPGATAVADQANTSPPPLIFLNGGCEAGQPDLLTGSSYEAPPDPSNPSTKHGEIVCNPALSVQGDVGIAGTTESYTVATTSDARLKTSIHTLHDALADLMKVDPVSFVYKKTGHKGMGVIAQDLQKIYPQLVVQGYNGYLFVNYDGLIGPLIASVQELKRQNDDLRHRVDQLEKKDAARK